MELQGVIPGVGFVFDGINAAWYAAEGDYFNAACSLVSALPGVGDAIVVFTKRVKAYKVVTVYFLAAQQDNKK